MKPDSFKSLRAIISKIISEQFMSEAEIVPPAIPNTRNFWHGGNLENYDDNIAQKKGRYEYGPGLYLTTHYDTARKYSKGSRKFYMVTVENGVDLNDSYLDVELVKGFLDKYVLGKKKRETWERFQKHIKDGRIAADVFNNILLNESAIKPANTKYLRSFLVENGIDYEIVNNAFGWGEVMMVLYNMKKIVKITQIGPKDVINNYDLS